MEFGIESLYRTVEQLKLLCETAERQVTLYLRGVNEVSSGFAIYVKGVNEVSSGFAIYVKGVNEVSSGFATFLIGFTGGKDSVQEMASNFLDLFRVFMKVGAGKAVLC
jgi:hypothetical protein